MNFNLGRRGLSLLVTLLVPLFALDGQSIAGPREQLVRAAEQLDTAIARYDDDAIAAAADAIRRVIEANPRFAEAYVRLGEALLWLDAPDRAQEHFADARALRYRGVDLPLLEARLQALRGDLAAAAETYDTILAAAPYTEEARVGRAIVALAGGSTDAALRELQDLSRRFPENRQLLAALARVTRERGETAAFERYLRLALQYHGDAASIQLMAARFALDEGNTADARAHGQTATALAPALTEAWEILAEAAMRDGDVSRALAHYEELIRLEPDNHRAWYARGELQARAGNLEDARRSWERAMRIRPDFEFARYALENTVLESRDLDDPLRAELAARYRETGGRLEDRFLSRQAERQYRRGLQLNPFDGVLRARLAELYLQQDMPARYLQELEIIRSRDLAGDEPGLIPSQRLSDAIEAYRGVLRNSVAVSWDVDQFTAPRPRTTIALVARQRAGPRLPGAARHLAQYVASLLEGSQNVEHVSVTVSDEPVSALVGRYRRDGAERLAVLDISLDDRSISIFSQLIATGTAELIRTSTTRRSGNGRVDAVARRVAAEIDGTLPVQGTVLRRRFERLVISLGAVDGLVPEQEIEFVAEPDGLPLGTGTVIDVDDLVAEVSYSPDGPDNLTTGDRAIPGPRPTDDEPEDDPEEETQEEAETPPATPVETPPSDLRQTVTELFRIR